MRQPRPVNQPHNGVILAERAKGPGLKVGTLYLGYDAHGPAHLAANRAEWWARFMAEIDGAIYGECRILVGAFRDGAHVTILQEPLPCTCDPAEDDSFGPNHVPGSTEPPLPDSVRPHDWREPR